MEAACFSETLVNDSPPPPPPLLFLLLILLLFLLLILLLFLLLLLLLLALQSLVDLSLFPNYPPLFSVPLLTSPVPHAHVLHIFLNRFKPPKLRFSYMSSAFWFKKSKF
jgi:hypothetical protein